MTRLRGILINNASCCVCYNLSDSMLSCQNAHAICFDCVQSMSRVKCPVCNCTGSLYTASTCRIIAEMGIVRKCMWCEGAYPVSEIKHHEMKCTAALFQCPIEPSCCHGTFFGHEMAHHMRSAHPAPKRLEVDHAVIVCKHMLQTCFLFGDVVVSVKLTREFLKEGPKQLCALYKVKMCKYGDTDVQVGIRSWHVNMPNHVCTPCERYVVSAPRAAPVGDAYSSLLMLMARSSLKIADDDDEVGACFTGTIQDAMKDSAFRSLGLRSLSPMTLHPNTLDSDEPVLVVEFDFESC